MPTSKQEQEPYITTTPGKPRIDVVMDEAAKRYSVKKHDDRGLPQIRDATTSNSFIPWFSNYETNVTPEQIEAFIVDYDNDPKNNFARVWVDDADVTCYLQSNPDWTAFFIEQDGEDYVRQTTRRQLQVTSFLMAMENMFGGYEPDPTDRHYLLWKEYRRLMSLHVEEIRDEACADLLVCGDNDDDDAIRYNTKIIEQYEALRESDRKFENRLQAKLLLAEIAARRTSATAVIWASHRTPHRARRTTAGHGAATKAGDDGDGDGEPPRPRSSHSPTPSLHNSLTHSLIFVGGAQW